MASGNPGHDRSLSREEGGDRSEGEKTPHFPLDNGSEQFRGNPKLHSRDLEPSITMPVFLVQSLEDMMTESLGTVVSTGIMYEIGRKVAIKALTGSRLHGLGVEGMKGINRELSPLLGWALIRHSSLDGTRKLLRLRLTGSLFVRQRESRTAVCHYSRGVAAAAMELLSGKKCEAIEILCEGKGDGYCEIIAGDPEEIFLIAEAFDGVSSRYTD